ncbi:M56 family metallopeptidase [Stackebrandtia sp.]|uniref:M56 family metallopeptidase n=1 Tax=Stackebrandtia sp. TaxID=2023065 RepID=UPI0032C2295D
MLVRSQRHTRDLKRTLTGGSAANTELIVADSEEPRAFAIPGRPGHVFVTTAMLRGLNAAEREVLLAHERAHLRHHHGWLRLLVDVAAAVDPLLIPLRGDVEFLLERWADEHAARATGDRDITARALARAALLSANAQRRCALAFADQAVIRRVDALRNTPPRPARAWAAIVVACALVVPVITADATGDFVDLFWRILPG